MPKNRLFLLVELLWWAITAVVVVVVLLPMYLMEIDWIFQATNIFFIVTLLTLGRHIFALNYSLIGTRQVLKAGILIAMFPLTFALISHLNGFMVYVEEHLWDSLTGHLTYDARRKIESYMWNEMLFFGVGSIIAAPSLSVRLFLSLWRQYNAEKHSNYQNNVIDK